MPWKEYHEMHEKLRFVSAYTDPRTFGIGFPTKKQKFSPKTGLTESWWPRAESKHRHTDFPPARQNARPGSDKLIVYANKLRFPCTWTR